MDGTPRRGVVVVGVDGSGGADAALRHAMEEAARRDAVVRAVIALRAPEPLDYEMYVLPDPAEQRATAAADVERRIEELREQTGLAVEAEGVAITGSPVRVLVESAADAELLVVGHRGRGAWRSALLGSVALGVVLRAPCPVTVVPAPLPAPEAASPRATEPAAPLPVGPIA